MVSLWEFTMILFGILFYQIKDFFEFFNGFMVFAVLYGIVRFLITQRVVLPHNNFEFEENEDLSQILYMYVVYIYVQ